MSKRRWSHRTTFFLSLTNPARRRRALLVYLLICGIGLSSGCRTMSRRESIRQDINAMARLLETGDWEELAEHWVIPARVEESKDGLENEWNRRVLLAVLRMLAARDPEFSSDGRHATFLIDEEDLPDRWRFEKVEGHWRIAEVH